MKRLQVLIVLVFIATSSRSQDKHVNLFVFVCEKISLDTITKEVKGYAKLKYKILEKTYGTCTWDTIDFFAYYVADSLQFTQYKTVLLFLLEDDKKFYKMAMPFYHVYKTLDGRWASGAQGWDYIDNPTTIKPKRIKFRDPIFFNTKGMSQEQINHWYPAKYYERKNGKARPVFGNYTNELFELNKTGFLRGTFFKN